MKRSYKELRTELDNVLEAIQDPEVDIDKALELHEQAQKIVKELEQYLDQSELKIKQINTK